MYKEDIKFSLLALFCCLTISFVLVSPWIALSMA